MIPGLATFLSETWPILGALALVGLVLAPRAVRRRRREHRCGRDRTPIHTDPESSTSCTSQQHEPLPDREDKRDCDGPRRRA